MFSRHTSKESVREYLLGTLDERGTAWIEEKCFSDSAFFEWVWRLEEELIRNYLRGQLPAREREQFERRYGQIPALRKRLEEVRNRPANVRRFSFGLRWEFAAAGFMLAVCVVSWYWLHGHDGSSSVTRAKRPPTIVPTLAVQLTPGLIKGAEAKQVEFAPPPGGKVQLSLELPGRTASVTCRLVLAIIDADRRSEIVWTSDVLKSGAAGLSQEVDVEVDGAHLRPGDYLGTIQTPGGDVMETYSFRVDVAR